MEGEPDNKDRITKSEWLSKRTTKKLEQSKNIDRYDKKSNLIRKEETHKNWRLETICS